MDRKLRTYTKRNLRTKSNLFDKFSVTMWLIIANLIFYIIGLIVLIINPDNIKYIALQPSYILQGKYLWTFFTSMFMHAPGQGLFLLLSFHLLINMFVLFSLGSFCEKIIGKKRFFWFYLISGLIAGLAFVILSGLLGNTGIGARIFGDPMIAAVGASGAIFAIAGLFVILTPKLKFMIIFLPFFSLPAYIMIPLVLFLTWIVSSGTGLPVGNTAHFGGFMAGIVYGIYLRSKYKRKIKMLNKYIR